MSQSAAFLSELGALRGPAGVALAALLAVAGFAAAADEDLVIADFEGDGYAGWTVTGEAFGSGPAHGTLPGQQAVQGFLGKGLVNSFLPGDRATGTLTSPAFAIARPYLSFLIGGGKDAERLALTLVVDGQVVRRATGQRAEPGGKEELEAGCWEVGEFMGRSAIIRIVDQATGGWGHLTVDQLVQSGRKPAVLLSEATRTLTIAKRYLHLPIRNGAPKRVLTTLVGGRVVVRNEVELADAKPDWWAVIDVGPWQGQEVTLQADRLPETSTALSAIVQDDAIPGAATLYREPLRGQFHFSSRLGWLNDPNGLVFFNGEYHLFYQHNPYGTGWGNMHWGHATSSDLVHWQEHGDVLAPDASGAMFSGSAVVDWHNTSGLGEPDHPPLVLIYTAAGNPTVQCLASSTDGRRFSKFAGNPVLPQITGGNRDPKVQWHEASKRWVMVLYVEKTVAQKRIHTVHVLTSANLREWTLAGVVDGGGDGSHYLFECPDLFALPLDGRADPAAWVLLGANDEYAIGRFDGARFTPEHERLRGDHGRGFYAAQSFSDIPAADGRRIQIGWFQTPTPGMPFNQSMTVPQQLALITTPDGPRLTRTPVRELESLRVASHRPAQKRMEPGGMDPLAGLSAELVELRADLVPGDATEVRFTLRGAGIAYDVARQELRVGDLRCPAPLRDGHLRLCAYVDRMAIEVFASDGLAYVPLPFIPKTDDRSLTLGCTGGSVQLDELVVHELGSSWR